MNNHGKRVMGIGNACIASSVAPLIEWIIPDYLSLEEAATIPVVYLTSLYALFVKAKLKKGDSILIHSGSGGVTKSAW